MPKVLFLGCNHDQTPYLEAALKLGFAVIATDKNPDAPGAKLANRFYPVSYTDTKNLEGIIRREQLGQSDHIFTASSHFAYEAAAHLAAKIGLEFPSPEVINICLDKSRLYPFLNECNISVPQTTIFNPHDLNALKPDKEYFLKSDYGKSPKYCFQISKGHIPELPSRFDNFYRRHFLLQESVAGTHYRINLFNGSQEAAIFIKFSDTSSAPLSIVGPGHKDVINKLQGLVNKLALSKWLVKFDIIVNSDDWYVIDIGLDPPLRLKLLYDYVDMNFADYYTSHYLQGERMLSWAKLCRPILIKGTPGKGFDFIPLVKEE